MTLLDAKEGSAYTVRAIETVDEELEAFLFTLGCYPGEPITLVSRRRKLFIISIQDGRYCIDQQLAGAIHI